MSKSAIQRLHFLQCYRNKLQNEEKKLDVKLSALFSGIKSENERESYYKRGIGGETNRKKQNKTEQLNYITE